MPRVTFDYAAADYAAIEYLDAIATPRHYAI